MVDFDFNEVENKWQKKWEQEKVFTALDESGKEKYYALEMFPYPSGTGLHIGHMWNYLIGDIVARFKRMNNFNVLHPMGYDALGLPAENAAIKDGTHPEDYTNNSIKNFMRQQKRLGLTFDWSRMINTASSDYYKWDQWIFTKMFEKGLAYQKESNVNWCPSCKTVLANEQAQTGNCDRCGTKVEIKYLRQWFLKITDYADELYAELDNLPGWPERTKAMQRNWIGKSHGTEIDFEVNGEKWPVFTTRADTIFGVTFVVVSAQHRKLWDLVTGEQKGAVEEFLKKLKSVSEKDLADMEKEGVFTGSYAINPATGDRVPIYAGNFVVADYGSGMVMAVPAHDQRDFEFAKKYGIEIKTVILPENKESFELGGGNLAFVGEGDFEKKRQDVFEDKLFKMINSDWEKESHAFTGKGKLIRSGEFNGLSGDEAISKVREFLEKKGLARKVTNFRLRDWGISRQRYWGTPIPIVHCEKCGEVPVPEKDLPVKLPKDVKFGEGNPLETNEGWVKTTCPKCGGEARRETDTMDTFVNSSWYFTRYCDPKNSEEIFDKDKVDYWCPVDTYVGGSEHACMHLIYARFYTKFLADLGLLKFREPFKKLFHQGFIYGEDGEKMSKSRGNTVDPIDTVEKYGVDTTRFFLVSVASPDKDFAWSEAGIIGSQKLINRIVEFSQNFKEGKDSEELIVKLNKTIKNVTEYYQTFEYRKATIELRELFEEISKVGSSKETYGKFLKLLNPICPHVTEEFWEGLGNKDILADNSWPNWDENKLKVKKKEIDLNEKIVEMIKPHLEKISCNKVYLYVIPFEIEKLNSEKLEKELGKEVGIYSVKDSDKYDPENKAKKSRPGQPSFYLE